MFILGNKRKESGLSLIEASLVIIIAGLVIVLIQSAISKIINTAVHENALHDVSYAMSYIQNTLQASCYEESSAVCDDEITSVSSTFNTSEKIKVQITRQEQYVSVYILYTLASNEDFDSMLSTYTGAYYGKMDSSSGIVNSVLGWWKVDSRDTIFSGADNDGYLFFYNNFRVDISS